MGQILLSDQGKEDVPTPKTWSWLSGYSYGGTNPWTGQSDSRPFYIQADEMMQKMAPFSGPESLPSEYQSKWTPVQGGDVWEKNMLAKQALESRGATDRMNAANSSNWATARSNMAMRGGLDQGARERLAANAAKTGIMNAQEQSRLDQMARLGIGAQGEDKRIDLEKYNNEGAMNNDRWNIGNAINQGNARNLYNMGRYNMLMQGYGADKTAEATENSGGSWLCTEASNSLSPGDWVMLKKLRRWAMRNNKQETLFYIYRCKPLVDRMIGIGADWGANKSFVGTIVRLVRSENMAEAYNQYKKTVVSLIKQYWPDCNDPVFLKGGA